MKKTIVLFLFLAGLITYGAHAAPINDLMLAVKSNDTTKAQAIMASDKMVVNQFDQQGLTPLMVASIGQQTNMMALLLKNGADINQTTDKNGYNALMAASMNGQTRAVDILIKMGPMLIRPIKMAQRR